MSTFLSAQKSASPFLSTFLSAVIFFEFFFEYFFEYLGETFMHQYLRYDKQSFRLIWFSKYSLCSFFYQEEIRCAKNL